MKIFDPIKRVFRQKGPEKEPPPEQLRKDRAASSELDEALEDSFPASDPPAPAAPKKRQGT